MKKYLGAILLCGLIAGIQPVQAESTVTLEKVFTQISPVFMQGHQGDINWIEGFRFSGDILLDGSKIGDVSGELMLLNPPLVITERSANGSGRFENDIPGIGRFEVFAQMTGTGNMESVNTGDLMFGWHGSLTNGSNTLAGLGGISAGVGSFNLFTLQGSAQEMLIYSIEMVE